MRYYNILALVAVVGVIGCSRQDHEISTIELESIMSKMTYARDSRTGICYSFLKLAKEYKPNDPMILVSFASVPCDKMPAGK